MAGGAVGMLVHRIAPFPTGDTGAYALVGMGTLFAGIIRAPMTSVFMIFEITQDYQILVPLMLANMLSFVISRRYQPVPIYHALLHQDGIHLPLPATLASVAARTARHVMRTDHVPMIPPDLSVEDAWTWALERDLPTYLVGTPDRLEGSVTRQQLENWRGVGRGAEPVVAVVDGSFVHVHPDHPIEVVVDRLPQSGGILPVVSRMEARRLEGVITPHSLLALGDHQLQKARTAGSSQARVDLNESTHRRRS
jgi:CIC family chloride channel protein